MSTREEFLLDIIRNGKSATWSDYATKYGVHPEKARKWWRMFKNRDLPKGILYPSRPMTDEEKREFMLSDSPRYEHSIGINYRKFNDDGSQELKGVSDMDITTLDELMEFCQVDRTQWIVKSWICNVWQSARSSKSRDVWEKINLYQVKANLIPVNTDEQKALEAALEQAVNYIPKRSTPVFENGTGIGVACVADIHLGAEVKDLVRTPDFNINVLIEKLRKVADRINALKYYKVHLIILGDLIESFSGLNHLNTWKSLGMGMYGHNLLILADQIFNEHLISRINNLEKIYIVAGNHDRVTPSKDVDNEGEFACMFGYFLQRTLPEVDVEFERYILRKEIDGIHYIMTHGDKNMNKKDVSKMINDFGSKDRDMYNVLLEGHTHQRKTKKTFRSGMFEYEDVEMVFLDELKYRKETIPAVFTGNYYSETSGFAGTSGVTIFQNSGDGVPDKLDLHIP